MAGCAAPSTSAPSTSMSPEESPPAAAASAALGRWRRKPGRRRTGPVMVSIPLLAKGLAGQGSMLTDVRTSSSSSSVASAAPPFCSEVETAAARWRSVVSRPLRSGTSRDARGCSYRIRPHGGGRRSYGANWLGQGAVRSCGAAPAVVARRPSRTVRLIDLTVRVGTGGKHRSARNYTDRPSYTDRIYLATQKHTTPCTQPTRVQARHPDAS